MNLSAHTNAVGIHNLHEFRHHRSYGEVYDVATGEMVPLDRTDAWHSVHTAASRKPPPYQGDRRTSYDYWRGIERVTGDEPIKFHHYYDNPVDHKTSNYDYISEEFISVRRTPFTWNPIHGPTASNSWDESVTDALNSLKGVQADWGASLGELKTSVEAISRDATRAYHFLRAMKRGKWQEAAYRLGITPKSLRHSSNRGRALADYWLAYSYGWSPLAQTMYDTQDAFSEEVRRRSNLIEGTGRATVSGSGSFRQNDLDQSYKWKVQSKTVLKATIDDRGVQLISKFGLTNPIAIAWELVPFSFAVDWFIPIGNTLSAMTAGMGLTWHGGQTTQRLSYELTARHKTGQITPWTTVVDGGNYQERGFGFTRIALAGFPYARFFADLTPYSTPRALNALALVRSLTK